MSIIGSVLGGLASKAVGSFFGGSGKGGQKGGSGGSSGSFLGSLFRGGASAVLGGSIDRKFDQSARSDQYSFLADKGLTPQEIAGSGFGDGRGSQSGTILGNQLLAQQQAERQQAYDRAERAKDRAVAMRGQDASLASSQISANASVYSSDTSSRVAEMNNALQRDVFENVTLPDALRRSVTESPPWKRAQIMATMGVDNMIGTAIGNKYGLNPMDPSALASMSQGDFNRMVSEIYGLQSNIFGEAAGAAQIGTTGLGLSFGQSVPSLGRSGSSQGRNP